MLGHTATEEGNDHLNSAVETPNLKGQRDREELIQAIKAAQVQGADGTHANFSGQDLSGLDLSGVQLPGANFSDAILSGCRFTRANLAGAVFTQARLDDADFLGANLDDSEFGGAEGQRVGFAGVSAQEARFVGARLASSSFVQANMRGADFRGAFLPQAHFQESQLQQADFTRADLQRADLESAEVSGTSFDNVDLHEARLRSLHHFEQASWIGADIQHVDFCGAYLVRRHIQDENYLYEFRNRNSRNEYLYKVWWLTSDCGRSLLRWAVMIACVIVLFALLYSLVEIDYGKYPTRISPLYYSIVTLTTLGYGDSVPTSVPGQVLAIMEAMLGYVFLGGFLSIFSNKMSRRAD